jgi:hypothetical protein
LGHRGQGTNAIKCPEINTLPWNKQTTAQVLTPAPVWAKVRPADEDCSALPTNGGRNLRSAKDIEATMKSGILSWVGAVTLAALAISVWTAAQETPRQAKDLSKNTGTTNPVPLIYQPLVPDSTKPGSADFTLTVNGTGFVSGSVVNWNGSARATTFVNSSQLTAKVLAADVSAATTATVTVVNPSPGNDSSNPLFFPITPPGGISVIRSDYSVGSAPPFVSTADLTGAGKLDLVATDSSNHRISVLLGNGDGTFQTGVTYPVGQDPTDIAIADFNGDGKPDLAITNTGSNTVSVLLGNGDGTFQAGVQYVTGTGAYGIAAADVNGDGKLDLVVTNSGSATISVLLGNGDGTFQPHVDYGAGSVPTSVAVGDFNRDGNLDLAVADFASVNTVSVLLGNGDGTFSAPTMYAAGSLPRYVTTADFNGDGKLDLAVANQGDSTISILLGNGDGAFQPQVTYGTGFIPTFIIAADFNGDGKLDLATPDYGDGSGSSVSVLLGNGDGTFQQNTDYATGLGPDGIAVGDFNGDGRLDLASANQSSTTLSVLLQVSTVTLKPTTLNLGAYAVGTTSAARAVTLTNGPFALSISNISITGANAGDFSQTNSCASGLAVGADCKIHVTFTPSQVGAETASLSITDNGGGSPQTVPLRGIGTTTGPNATLSPSNLIFVPALQGFKSAPQLTTLANYGTEALNITNLTITGTNQSSFAQRNHCPASLRPLESCRIDVTFTPPSAGSFSAYITVDDNATNSPQQVALSGIGVATCGGTCPCIAGCSCRHSCYPPPCHYYCFPASQRASGEANASQVSCGAKNMFDELR